MEEESKNPFAVNFLAGPAYDHGYPADKVEEIKQLKSALEKRINNGGEAVSIEEFETIIVPWNRINRVEAFILNPEKPKKEKVPKEPKAPRAPRAVKEKGETAPKEKKMSKKEIGALLSSIIMKLAMKQEITEEEQEFYNKHTQDKIV